MTDIPGGDLLPPIPREMLDALGIPEDPAMLGLFEGYGGLTLGVKNAVGGHLVCYSEIEKHSIRLLEHHFPGVPNLGDVSKIDWSPWVGKIIVASGGFPCQDVSHAGLGRGLVEGTRSGLWYEFARAISETRPKLVVIENVAGLRSTKAGASAEEVVTDEELEDADIYSYEGDRIVEPGEGDLGFSEWEREPIQRALGVVLWDLAALGYDAEWHSVRASNVGATHRRERVFILAWPAGGSGNPQNILS